MADLIINCDWGTTRFRLRAVEPEPFAVAAEFRSDEGVARLAGETTTAQRPDRYRAVLAAGLRELAAQAGDALACAPVLISGMASSSIGWQEVDYARLPLALDGSQLPWRELPPVESVGRHRVLLISGARSETDVMRGEETELVGLFSLSDVAALAARSLVIKPGTHTKHLRVEGGRIVGLETFMTGELFDVLGRHSILRHSIDAPSGKMSSADDVDDLRAGVRQARTAGLSAGLFRVRTRQLLDGLDGAANRAFLSGVLVGAELMPLAQWTDSALPVVLCATASLEWQYVAALEELGLSRRLMVIPPAEVEGLSARGQAAFWQIRAASDRAI